MLLRLTQPAHDVHAGIVGEGFADFDEIHAEAFNQGDVGRQCIYRHISIRRWFLGR